MTSYEKGLEKNIVKYSWFKIFTKRLYLPIIAIQLVNVGKVSLEQLAIIASVTSIVTILLQIPTGYIADKWGNKVAILIGSVITTISPLFYIFMPNFVGGMAASVLFFGGYTFSSGAIEAFMHDTLSALNRAGDYSKVMGRAQSYGLFGNVILIAIVPATYAINTNLPFIIGFISLAIMTWLASIFTYPKSVIQSQPKSRSAAIKGIINSRNIVLFIFAGFLGAVANKAPEYRELLYQNLGIATSLFGVLVAIGSLAGVLMGLYIHRLDRLNPSTFYLFDVTFISSCLIISGVFSNQIFAVIGFVLFSAYGRVRMIVFQSKMLSNLQHVYKATLLSTLSMFTAVIEIGVAFSIVGIINMTNYSLGYALFGCLTLLVGLILWLVILIEGKTDGFKKIKRNAV